MKILLDLSDVGGVGEKFDELAENFDGHWSQQPFYLGDGIYHSKQRPIRTGEIMFDTETDFMSNPYQSESVIVWQGEKPKLLSGLSYDDMDKAVEGQANYGCNLTFEVTEPGFITICAEDD